MIACCIGACCALWLHIVGACCAHWFHVAHFLHAARCLSCILFACCAHWLHVTFTRNHRCMLRTSVAYCSYWLHVDVGCMWHIHAQSPVPFAHIQCQMRTVVASFTGACCAHMLHVALPFFCKLLLFLHFAHLANACFTVVAFESCCILCNLCTLPMLVLLHCYVSSVVASNIFIVPPSYVLWHYTSRLR